MRACIIFIIMLLPLAVTGQQTRPTYQAKADSILCYFLGKEIFNKYVRAGKNLQGRHHMNRDNESFFDYNFTSPRSGLSFSISFMLDSGGNFVPNAENHGLFRIDSLNDANWISAQKALNICKGQSYRLKKKSLRLTWDTTSVSYDEYNKTHNFRDIIPGDLVWEIDGKVKFRGDVYSGRFQVNVFTGQVARLFAIPWD